VSCPGFLFAILLQPVSCFVVCLEASGLEGKEDGSPFAFLGEVKHETTVLPDAVISPETRNVARVMPLERLLTFLSLTVPKTVTKLLP